MMYIYVITWKDRTVTYPDIVKRVRDWDSYMYRLGLSWSDEDFKKYVERCKAMIRAGDITGAEVSVRYSEDRYAVCWCSGFDGEEWTDYNEES